MTDYAAENADMSSNNIILTYDPFYNLSYSSVGINF